MKGLEPSNPLLAKQVLFQLSYIPMIGGDWGPLPCRQSTHQTAVPTRRPTYGLPTCNPEYGLAMTPYCALREAGVFAC